MSMLAPRPQALGGEVLAGCVAARRKGELSGLRLRVGDQFLHVLDRQLDVDRQHARGLAEEHDADEVLARIVVERRAGRRNDQVLQRHHAHRVAIGRLGDRVHRDDARASGLVLDDERLPQRILEHRLQIARESRPPHHPAESPRSP
jgi:hypothetical protein